MRDSCREKMLLKYFGPELVLKLDLVDSSLSTIYTSQAERYKSSLKFSL